MFEQIKNKLRNDRIWLKSILSRGSFGTSVRRALFLGAHLVGNLRSSRDKVFRDCFMRVVWLKKKYVEQITLKLCLTILIEMKFWCRSWFRSSSRGSSSNNESHYVGNLVDINLTVIDRYMLEWWIVLKGTCVPGQSTQGKVPKRMLRGYTSLLREHREGENRIFWKEEEDFLGKHRRRFTSRALPRAECHNP